jgi:CHASE3 domain sensor protein
VRLRLSFACLMSLMLIGSTLLLWQFHQVGSNVERASQAAQRLTTVLALDNSMLTLMNRIHRVADTHDPARFETTARKPAGRPSF